MFYKFILDSFSVSQFVFNRGRQQRRERQNRSAIGCGVREAASLGIWLGTMVSIRILGQILLYQQYNKCFLISSSTAKSSYTCPGNHRVWREIFTDLTPELPTNPPVSSSDCRPDNLLQGHVSLCSLVLSGSCVKRRSDGSSLWGTLYGFNLDMFVIYGVQGMLCKHHLL